MASQPTDPSSKRGFYVRDGPVKRLFGVAVSQRLRQATFWRRCVPAAPSSDFLVSLRASGSVMLHFGVAACQRPRHATF